MSDLVNSIVEPGYGIFPELISPDIQQELINLMNQKLTADKLIPAGVGAGASTAVRSEIRNDSIIWIEPDDPTPIIKHWSQCMDQLAEHFRSEIFLPIFTYEGHLARYPAKGFYKPHLDRHAQTQARQISIIIYLNDEWKPSDGGQLRLYTAPEKGTTGPHIDILPEAGTVVVFRSADFWHEVLPSTRPRLSLTGWLRGRE